MAEKTISVKVLQLTKTTAEWELITSVIDRGLLCVELTPTEKTRIKVGDGVKTYAELPYVDADVDLSDYYTKLEVDTAIETAIGAIGDVLTVKGVKATKEQLPVSGNKPGDVWFVGPDENSHYAEYAWIQPDPQEPGSWEEIGTSEIDLSAYATKEYVDDIADAINGRIDAITDFTPATASTDGASGLVPAPQAGDQDKFLKGDGTWVDSTYDDTALSNRVSAIEEDYIKSTDDLILVCGL